MLAAWILATEYFDRWNGEDPLAIGRGIRELERALTELEAARHPSVTSQQWSQLLARASWSLGRLIDLSTTTDRALARRASLAARDLQPLLLRAAGTMTQKLARAWRAS